MPMLAIGRAWHSNERAISLDNFYTMYSILEVYLSASDSSIGYVVVVWVNGLACLCRDYGVHRVQCIPSATHQQIHFIPPSNAPSVDFSQPITSIILAMTTSRVRIGLHNYMIPVVAVETAESPEIVIWREIFRCNRPGFIELPKENARRDSES